MSATVWEARGQCLGGHKLPRLWMVYTYAGGLLCFTHFKLTGFSFKIPDSASRFTNMSYHTKEKWCASPRRMWVNHTSSSLSRVIQLVSRYFTDVLEDIFDTNCRQGWCILPAAFVWYDVFASARAETVDLHYLCRAITALTVTDTLHGKHLVVCSW